MGCTASILTVLVCSTVRITQYKNRVLASLLLWIYCEEVFGLLRRVSISEELTSPTVSACGEDDLPVSVYLSCQLYEDKMYPFEDK